MNSFVRFSFPSLRREGQSADTKTKSRSGISSSRPDKSRLKKVM